MKKNSNGPTTSVVRTDIPPQNYALVFLNFRKEQTKTKLSPLSHKLYLADIYSILHEVK